MGERQASDEERRDDDGLVDLMVAYQDGQLEAFEKIFETLAPGLRGYLISLTRRPDRAEDLLQETFLQMHRSRQSYSPPRPVKPWAFGIARNVWLMDRRSAARRSKHERPAYDELPDLPIEPVARMFPQTSDLGEALREVQEDRREALLLHHVWGFRYREIGAMLGITERAAKLRAFRGVQDLREKLGAT